MSARLVPLPAQPGSAILTSPPRRLRSPRAQPASIRLAGEIEAAREEERASIARDLHDELGSWLVRLKMELSLLAECLPSQPPQARERLISVEKLLDQALGTVQRVVSQLRPGLLAEFGLAEAIRCHVEEFSRCTGIPAQAWCDDIMLSDTDEGVTLFRVVQEALTNIAKHAQATHVDVRLRKQNGGLCLNIRDNGQGFLSTDTHKSGGFGLRGIRERILQLNGAVELTSNACQGCSLHVFLPIHQKSTSPTLASGTATTGQQTLF
jgi:two-component system sensor histidine kinase UhpB